MIYIMLQPQSCGGISCLVAVEIIVNEFLSLFLSLVSMLETFLASHEYVVRCCIMEITKDISFRRVKLISCSLRGTAADNLCMES